jgi:Zn-dependent M16 (insulinase) family peptidase
LTFGPPVDIFFNMPIQHPAYETISERELPEYRCKGTLLRHKKTGCELYKLEAADEENVFAFAFRTRPRNGTGVAHIVEHSVLCGSERFPVKDSFLVMARRSLATFMNAFTYPDKTVYPAASAVEADYFNLMDVYGDAVFFPRLTEDTFLQEAHRLEIDAEGRLDVKGVVYNEMRGDYSSSESLAATASYTSLFSPGHPYSFDSGGDPREIPELDYASFKAFWAEHYHPANCRIFLYGNIDAGRQLSFLDERFLSRFEARAVDSEIPLQPPIGEPRRVAVPYPLAEGSDSATSVIVNWLTVPVTDGAEALALELLSELLVGHDGAPLAKALRDSGLGEDLSPQCGLDTGFRQVIFSAGLRGAKRGEEAAIEELVVGAVEKAALAGFSEEALDAAMHSIAFSNREIRRGSGAYGLRLFNRAARGWLHGAGPEATLSFETPLAELKARMAADPRYLEGLALSLIARNPHRSTITVYPEAGLLEERRAERDAELAARSAALSASDKEAIRVRGAALDAAMGRADPPEAIATLPRLKRDELPRRVESIDRRERRIGGLRAISHPLFTNGIVYLDLAFPLGSLPMEALPWLPLTARFIVGAGLEGESYDKVAQRLARSAGGFSAILDSGTPAGADPSGAAGGGPSGGRRAASFAIFRIKALAERFPKAVDLALSLIGSADYGDLKRLEDICAELRNDVISAVVPSGNSFAQTRAASRFSEASAIEDLWRGTSQVEFLLGLKEAKGPDLASALGAISRTAFSRKGLLLNITAEEGAMDAAAAAVEAALPRLRAEGSGEKLPSAPFAAADRPEAFAISSQVGFAAAACPSSRLGQSGFGHESILTHLLSTGPLWEELRVRRGAYGASAWTDGLEGIACFSSYRDPRPLESLAFFGEALSAVEARFSPGVAGGAISDRASLEDEIEEAAIGSIGRELRPMMPEERGLVDFRRFLYGIEDSMRQTKRDSMLSARAKDIAAAAGSLAASYRLAQSVLISRAEDVQSMLRGRPETRARELPL